MDSDEAGSASDGVERMLTLLKGLAELGLVPLSVRCGDVEVQVARLMPTDSGNATEAPTVERSYVGRALADRRTR